MDVDSVAIVGGKFKFEGVAEEALAHGLTTKKDSRRPMVFFLDNDHMKVEMNESEKFFKVTNSVANDIYFQNAGLVRTKG